VSAGDLRFVSVKIRLVSVKIRLRVFSKMMRHGLEIVSRTARPIVGRHGASPLAALARYA